MSIRDGQQCTMSSPGSEPRRTAAWDQRVLIANAASFARKCQTTPTGYYNREGMTKMIIS